jgi:hypothetical protein
MKVYRYNDAAQKALGTRTKTEPWLHFAVHDDKAVIWILDTRRIIAIEDIKGQVDRSCTMARDNHQPLNGKDAEFYNECFDFMDERLLNAIKASLTNRNKTLRTIACLKACVRIYLEGQTAHERHSSKSLEINNRGFSRYDAKTMTPIAKACLQRRRPTILSIQHAWHVMPHYAKQLAILSMQGTMQNKDADEVEKWLRWQFQK